MIRLTDRLPMSRPLWLTALVVFLYALTSSAALAQATEMQTAEEFLAELQETLELSDAQSEEIKPIIIKGRESQKNILASYGIDLESDGRPEKLKRRTAMKMRGELKDARKAMMKELSAVLTDEQLETYTEMQEERAEEQRNAIRERIRGG